MNHDRERQEKRETTTVKRPWGQFEQFTFNEPSTDKIISVKPGEELSLQYHERRQEFWKVLRGTPDITIGSRTVRAKRGDEFFVAKRQKHRIACPAIASEPAEILEIAFGDFDEKDIVRIDDKYGRA